MKILSIRIKNLASLAGEHFIDFEAEPLASVGLIAIVGKTGAGKSTILDAMCLALFNRIPRLKDSDGKLQDMDGSELPTNSPLTVLRRGTAHGFAELTFVAQDQKIYLARWELKRSREKADGKLQSVQRYLKCITDGVTVADKTKAVDISIQKITQLSFEQFTRAVLLAQSEVTAFLKARDNERGELLEYLTDSAIFAKIGQLAFERTKAVASKRKELESFLGNVDILSDEQVTELNLQFNQVDTDYKKFETEKIQLEQQRQWFERQQKLHIDIATKQQAVDKNQKIQQDLASERTQLARLEVFSEIRSQVDQQQELVKIAQQLVPKIQKQQLNFDTLQTRFDAEKTDFTQAEDAQTHAHQFEHEHREALDHIRTYMQEREFIGKTYKSIQNKILALINDETPLTTESASLQQNHEKLTGQLTQIQQQLESTKQFSNLDQSLTTHLHQLKQFIPQYQKIEDELGQFVQAEQQLAEQKIQLAQSIAQVGTVDQIEQKMTSIRLQRDQFFQQHTKLDSIQQKLTHFFDLNNETVQWHDKLATTTVEWQSVKNKAIEAEQYFQSAKNERLKLHAILQQQRLLHAENVENLRTQLHDGEPCFVCGSMSHPYKMDDSAVSKALFELHQQQEHQATENEQRHLNIWQNIQEKQTQLNTQVEQFTNTIQTLTDKKMAVQSALIQQTESINIQLNLTQSQAEINTQLHIFTKQFEKDLQQCDVQTLQLNQSIKQQQQLTQQIQKTEHLLQSAQNLQMQVQFIVDCLSLDEQQQWQQHSSQTAQLILARLNTRVLQREQLQSVEQQLELNIQQAKTNQLQLENIQKFIVQERHNAEIKKQEGIDNTEKASTLIYKISGVQADKPQEWLAEYDTQKRQVQQNYQVLKQSFESLRHQFEYDKNQLDQLKVQVTQNQEHSVNININIEQWLNQHSNFQMQDLSELAQVSPAQEQHIRQQLQTAEHLLTEALGSFKTMQEQLAQHLQHQPDIDLTQLQQLIVQNTESLKSQLEVRDSFKLKLELHQQNIAKQKQFADQIAEVQVEEHRWSKISGLMGDANGKKFRDYAQQYNLDILLEHANQQLTMLSQRYTLKRLDDSLSLAIIDHDMDGETRSVASLSGGESFLTALALSLAIANMASGSTKIESLFIDEGFGTLDASSLHMVMNALDQLQNQGRKVVLISHIQEMHERIPVQIQVRPLGAGASTIEVVN